MSLTDNREPREIAPVQFFTKGADLHYARGEGFSPLESVPEPTAEELAEAARLEAELMAADGTAPKDAVEPPLEEPPLPPPSPDDPESKVASGKGKGTPAKN